MCLCSISPRLHENDHSNCPGTRVRVLEYSSTVIPVDAHCIVSKKPLRELIHKLHMLMYRLIGLRSSFFRFCCCFVWLSLLLLLLLLFEGVVVVVRRCCCLVVIVIIVSQQQHVIQCAFAFAWFADVCGLLKCVVSVSKFWLALFGSWRMM